MTMLSVEIVTPDGVVLRERAATHFVVHRREAGFDIGSEIAIHQRHAPALVRLPIAPARLATARGMTHLALAGGFVQVAHDRALVVTPRCEPIDRSLPDPRNAARELCDQWRAHAGDEIAALAGAG